MKLHFEANLDYQLAAIESVCNLFRGQEICRTEFTVTRDFGRVQAALARMENDLGIGNRLTLLDDEILANLDEAQLRNGLRPSDSLASGDFTVEMETGTGKTTNTLFTTPPESSVPLRNRWRRANPSRFTPNSPASSRFQRRSGLTILTGPCS